MMGEDVLESLWGLTPNWIRTGGVLGLLPLLSLLLLVLDTMVNLSELLRTGLDVLLLMMLFVLPPTQKF
jgi:hypothetical protein